MNFHYACLHHTGGDSGSYKARLIEKCSLTFRLAGTKEWGVSKLNESVNDAPSTYMLSHAYMGKLREKVGFSNAPINALPRTR